MIRKQVRPNHTKKNSVEHVALWECTASLRLNTGVCSPYSRAALGSWMLQGPTMTSNLSSLPLMMLSASLRAVVTVLVMFSVRGSSSIRIWGGMRGFSSTIRRSSIPLLPFLKKSVDMFVFCCLLAESVEVWLQTSVFPGAQSKFLNGEEKERNKQRKVAFAFWAVAETSKFHYI